MLALLIGVAAGASVSVEGGPFFLLVIGSKSL